VSSPTIYQTVVSYLYYYFTVHLSLIEPETVSVYICLKILYLNSYRHYWRSVSIEVISMLILFVCLLSTLNHEVPSSLCCYIIVFNWTNSQYEIRPSPEDVNIIDQPAEATAWLNKLSIVNQRYIKQVLSCVLVICVYQLVTCTYLLVTCVHQLVTCVFLLVK